MQGNCAVAAACLIWLAGAPVAAQDATREDFKHLDMIEAARKKVTAVPSRPRCDAGNSEQEIVVCAPDNGEDLRVPPSSDAKPNLNTGDLRPPDFVPKYPGPVVARGCFVPPCPKPPVYFFDIAALPEAAGGSDADKVGKGDVPAR